MKKMKFNLLLIIIMFNMLNLPTQASNSPSNWAIEFVNSSRDRGILTEKVQNNYQSIITREEFAEMTVKLYEHLSGKGTSITVTNPFSDTENNNVIKAYELGIVKGDGKGEFNPHGSITREQLCTLIYRTVMKARQNIVVVKKDLVFSDTKERLKY